MDTARIRMAMALVLILPATAAATASAATPRASFNDIEDEVMCVTCNVPLNIAQSVQADDERREIKSLIAAGLTKQQVKDRLVADLGPQVLADPPRDGFNITTWLVPIGAVVGVGVVLLMALPRWRRRQDHADDGPDATEPHPAPSPEDLRRLDQDLQDTRV